MLRASEVVALELTFWGVRGSFPVARPHVRRYGGNTPCVQISAGGRHLVLDAGTGIRRLGLKLMEDAEPSPLTLLISHPHWDHIQGFPYFEPAYHPEADISIYSIRRPEDRLESLFSGQQHIAFFPTPLERLPSRVRFRELDEAVPAEISGFRVTTRRLNHPGITSGYRVERGGLVVAYLCDVAPSDLLLGDPRPGVSEQAFLRELYENQVLLAEGADVVLYDTFFTPQEYAERRHWGHSSLEDGLEVCRRAGARNLFMFHHNPERSDEDLAAQYASKAALGDEHGIHVHVATEGQTWAVREGRLATCG